MFYIHPHPHSAVSSRPIFNSRERKTCNRRYADEAMENFQGKASLGDRMAALIAAIRLMWRFPIGIERQREIRRLLNER